LFIVADSIRRFPSRFSFTLVDSTVGTDKGASVKLVGKFNLSLIKLLSSNFSFLAFDTENEDAFQTYIDEKIQLIATSFCWGDKGYVFIGTADDSLIQILLQFDREKQQFRTTRFADEEKFKNESSIGMFKKIRLHKLGLFCAGSDDIIRLITFENQDGTLQEANNVADIMELNGNVTTITFNQAFNNLFICSTQGVDIFDLITKEQKQSSLIPVSLGKIVDLVILNPASEVVVTIRDSGALEAWSIADGSRKFSTEINDQMISHIAASPVLPFIVVTSTTGFFYFYEINKDGFRLIHRLRVHSNDIRSIQFNPRGTILVSTGLDNSLFLMEIKTDQISVENIFQIIYRTDLDGEPFALDLDDFQNQPNNLDHDEQAEDENMKENSNETKIVIALNTKTEKFGRFLIIDFDWQQYRGIFME
jgi:WD40 repeat protein